jgi:hypothetical protein
MIDMYSDLWKRSFSAARGVEPVREP